MFHIPKIYNPKLVIYGFSGPCYCAYYSQKVTEKTRCPGAVHTSYLCHSHYPSVSPQIDHKCSRNLHIILLLCISVSGTGLKSITFNIECVLCKNF